jgi:protein-disulfide isomerase
MEPIFQQLLEKYAKDVKLVVKNFPLRSHRMALKAALAAVAAHNQGKFWEFHDKLFENHRSLTDQKIDEIAAELNLDIERFSADRKSPAANTRIFNDIRSGQAAGVRGTPALFINGKQVKQRSLQNISRMIEAELQRHAGKQK